ncbi:unnamed protein product [Urochloa humidicola]
MSDKQKGLINAVSAIFPDAEHRFCVRHMYQNFHSLHKGETLKNDVWAIARSSNIPRWEKNMAQLKKDSVEAYTWIEELPPNTWVRAFFSEFPKCDMLLNNNCDVFNRYILDARDMPILTMFEKMRCQLMNRFYTKKKEAIEKWKGTICPKVRKKVERHADYSGCVDVNPSGGGVFSVKDRDETHVVDVNVSRCDCRRWQLTGIPCSHAIACFRLDNITPEDRVHDCYSIATYLRAYGHTIMPIRGKEHWEKMNGVEVHPPMYEKKIGRPKKTRKKAPIELEGGTKISKHGVTMHCNICKSDSHNKKGHHKYAQQNQGVEGATTGATDGATFEEDDDSTVLQNIMTIGVNPTNDPSQTCGSMVFNLLNEGPLQANSRQPPGPLPGSFFVDQERDAMPPPRVTTTAMKTGRPRRARGTRGGTRGTMAGTGSTRARGTRGRGRTTDIEDKTDGRAKSTRGRGRKRAKRDDGSIRESIVEEVVMTQNAPANF